MSWNWLDIVLAIIILLAFILGLVKGLVRQIIGIVAVIVGLVLAAEYYPRLSHFLSSFISNAKAADFLGFFLIFITTLIAGWLLAFLISKLIRGGLKFINHLLGGVFGLLKGILISGVVVFAFLVFPIDRNAVVKSRLAPHTLALTKAAIYLIPQELKEKFRLAYEDIKGRLKKDGKKV